jgi:hypothetical protein
MFRAVPVSISVVALVGCGTPTACPAVLHGASLTIRLADGWGDAEPLSVTVRCRGGWSAASSHRRT